MPSSRTTWFPLSESCRTFWECLQALCWLKSCKVSTPGQVSLTISCVWFNSKRFVYSMGWLTSSSKFPSLSTIVSTTSTFSTCTICKPMKWCELWGTTFTIFASTTSFFPIIPLKKINSIYCISLEIFLPLSVPINITYSIRDFCRWLVKIRSFLVLAYSSSLILFVHMG